MAEINRISVLKECLSIMRQELEICSENYNGLIPKKGMEEAWEQGRRKVEILREMIQALQNESVRIAMADWQKDVMENGPSIDEEEWPPDDVWVPYALPWAEGRCIPEKRVNLKDGRWYTEYRYPKPKGEEDEIRYSE